MTRDPPASFHDEEQRLRHVYELRDRGIHGGRKVSREQRSLFHPGQLFMAQSFEWEVLRLLKREGYSQLETRRILDVGCGNGTWLGQLIRYGAEPANLAGIDLSAERIEQARMRLPSDVTLVCHSAGAMDFPDAAFDLLFQCTVFTSILDPGLKQQVASEMRRVVRPDGLIVWFDYFVDNPRNPDVRGVGRREIHALFADSHLVLRRVILAPPIARLIGPYSRLACFFLEKLSPLRAYYLAAIRPNKAQVAEPAMITQR